MIKEHLSDTVSAAQKADVTALSRFLLSNPSQPLLATGSGGADSVADLAALLYGARGGVSYGVSPYTLNSFSDAALKTSKLLLVSAGGHNADIKFVAKRALAVNPEGAGMFALHTGERNEVRKRFLKAGTGHDLDVPLRLAKDEFVSCITPLAYFTLLTRVFQPSVDLEPYKRVPEQPFTLCHNDGSPLPETELASVRNFVILHGSWGRPVAWNLEGKLVESGYAPAGVSDYRNFCHGRFIFISKHLEGTAIVMLVSPRERDIVERTRKFLPASTRLVLIESEADAPETCLDQLIRATAFFEALSAAAGVNPYVPSNPGRIDKRVPMNVPFTAELERRGPLTLP